MPQGSFLLGCSVPSLHFAQLSSWYVLSIPPTLPGNLTRRSACVIVSMSTFAPPCLMLHKSQHTSQQVSIGPPGMPGARRVS